MATAAPGPDPAVLRQQYKEEINHLKQEGLEMMEKGRKDVKKRAGRAVRRFLNYKGGRKKLKKAGVTLGITAAALIVGVATHGAALGVVAAIAAGEFAVSKLSDGAFAKFYGSNYVGVENTRRFIDSPDIPKTFDSKDESRRLASRAHKTIRRACQHYRKAHEKIAKLHKVTDKGDVRSCGDAADRLTLVFQAKHHYDKALLYIHPAYYLTQALFNLYEKMWGHWDRDDGEKRLSDFVATFIDDVHDDTNPCKSDGCCKRELSPRRAENDRLWNWHTVSTYKGDLDKTGRRLKKRLDQTDRLKNESFQNMSGLMHLVLYHCALADYEKRSLPTKVKHFMTNNWARRTKSEKVAFVGSQVLSAGATFGAGVGAHQAIEEGIKGAVGEVWSLPVGTLVEAAQKIGETVGDVGVDEAAEAGGKLFKKSSGNHTTASAGHAQEGQEELQDAAIHLWEALRAAERLEKSKSDKVGDCDDVIKALALCYKYKHHIIKAQEPLEKAIDVVGACVKALKQEFSELKNHHDTLLFEGIKDFVVKGDHEACGRRCVMHRGWRS